ncbi:MAG: CHASE3 domain-containing protein [Acetobacteraceae bacterium]|nr:CHASE3 domain-containing protein [Acetobacteraceae bacterium]
MPGRAVSMSPSRLWSRIGKRRTVGLALACVLIAACSVYSMIVLRDLRRANGWVEHTRQVMVALYEARGAIRNAEIAQRDFLGTGDEQFLTVYRHAGAEAAAALSRVAGLVVDDPGQQRRFTGLTADVAVGLARLGDGIAARQAAGPSAITPEELASRRAATEQIMVDIADMQAEEARLLQARQADAVRNAAWAQNPLILGTLGSVVLIVLIFRLMLTEAAVREQHARDGTAELGHAIQALRQRSVELRGREEQLRVLIEATPAAIVMFDRAMRYLAVSQRYRDDYCLGAQPLIGRSLYDVFPEIPQARRDVHVRCLAGATEHAEEEELPRPDGSIDWLRWEIRPWHDGDGAIGGIVVFTEVITARKRAEQVLAASEAQLRQAQKMEAIGQLTGGIAHDFNNMLGVIIGNIEFLQDTIDGNPEQAALTSEILNVALGGAELTRRLLTIARKQTVTPGAIALGVYLPNVVALLRRTLGDAIHISVIVADDLWPAWADQAQVGEALLNLAINARDAMPQGGMLLIEASNAHLDETYAAEHLEVVPADYVMVSVTDSGHGMPPEVLERAMEPFYTTKDTTLGTGLGLSMVYGFAKQSGGHIKIYSEVGRGTTVRLYLPCAVGDAAGQPDAPAGAEPPRGTASILVVDDNVPMGEVARRHLTALGYTVTLVEGGPAAMVLLESGRTFDMLLTDVSMPDGVTGYDLAELAVGLRPGLKVLLTTGYAGALGSSGSDGRHGTSYPLLRKPYRRQELAAQMRKVLDSRT